MKKTVGLILSALLICLCGCGMPSVSVMPKELETEVETDGEENMNMEDIICGGTTDTSDYNAPKVIESDDLTGISVGFYHEGKYDRSEGAYYTFYVKEDEDAKLILRDNAGSEGFEVDKSVLEGVQAIIRKYDLAQSNGIHKITAGLAPQYQECFLEAKYESGEYLSYSGNSDPASEWTGELLEYLGKIFADNGDDKYVIPKLSGVIKRFSLELKENGLYYDYDNVKVPVGGKKSSLEDIANGTDEQEYETKIRRSIYNEKDESEESVYAYPDQEYYDGLFDIVSNNEIRDFENLNTLSDFIGDEEPDAYYEFYIEFEDGNRISGAAVDAEAFEAFRPMAEELMAYIDNYLETHNGD